MADCVFCQISSGVIPSFKVYEDDLVFAFLDNYPFSEGHTLIVPKKHYLDITDIDINSYVAISKVAKQLAAEYTNKLECDGFNLHNNSGEAAEQTVFHFHLHLVPRYKNDGIKFGGPSTTKPNVELKAVQKKLSL